MSVESLHIQVNNLQNEKLGNDKWFNRDTAMEDLANRSIETFQKSLLEIGDAEIQADSLNRLLTFLNSLGGNLDENDLQELLDVLTPVDSIEDFSLDDGRLMLGADDYIEKSIMSDIIYNAEYLKDMSKEQILASMWGDMKYTHESKAWDTVSLEEQKRIKEKTLRIYASLSKIGFTEEEVDAYMKFGPTLLQDLESPKIQERFSNPEEKQRMLQSLETQEEKIYFLRLWDFVNTSPEERLELVSNDGLFANNLRRFGVQKFMEYLDIPSFSQSPEIEKKKTELFDFLSSNLEGEELEQMMSVYSIYLEYAGESSYDIDDYIRKINDFQDMLNDEFKGGGKSIVIFMERLGVTLLSELKKRGLGKTLKAIRSGVRGITENPLETGIFISSFLPYAGDVIDFGYGAYKLTNGVNFSGDEISNTEASIQMSFGVVGMISNILMPGSGSLIKGIKAAGQQGVKKVSSEGIKKLPGEAIDTYRKLPGELLSDAKGVYGVIMEIGKKLDPFMDKILKLVDIMKDDFLKGIKMLKDFIIQTILPVTQGEIKNVLSMIK